MQNQGSKLKRYNQNLTTKDMPTSHKYLSVFIKLKSKAMKSSFLQREKST